MIREEFVFSLGGHKLYSIKDLDYFDDILMEEDARFWRNVRTGWAMVFLQKDRKYEKEPEPVLIAKMPVQDVMKKFG